MGCTRKSAFCLQGRGWQGDAVLLAFGKQASLRDALHLFFPERPVAAVHGRTARSLAKGHGRWELGELLAPSHLNDFLAKHWVGIAELFGLRRTVHHDGKTGTRVVSGSSSRWPEQA